MTHASLFSGIGGPEVAAAMLGWENLFHCEINPFGRKVLEYWFPDSVSYEDITKTSFKEWRGKVDVLSGGFPCQPFSYAGKRGGADDTRYLWPQMLRAIDEIRPAWVVGENVAGLATMVEGGVLADLGCYATLFQEGDELHGYELEQSFTIERICGDLERLGYSVQPVLIPAAAVGAPHRRDRIFILAFDADADRRNDVRGSQRQMERKKPGRDGSICYGSERASSNTAGDGLHGSAGKDGKERCAGGNSVGSSQKGADGFGLRCIAGLFSEQRNVAGLLPENRWADFPAVSPVHRGNDGLPFNVDDLTISFSRWRTESLKAYGNAIVPQVMYRIFEAIESITIK